MSKHRMERSYDPTTLKRRAVKAARSAVMAEGYTIAYANESALTDIPDLIGVKEGVAYGFTITQGKQSITQGEAARQLRQLGEFCSSRGIHITAVHPGGVVVVKNPQGSSPDTVIFPSTHGVVQRQTRSTQERVGTGRTFSLKDLHEAGEIGDEVPEACPKCFITLPLSKRCGNC